MCSEGRIAMYDDLPHVGIRELLDEAWGQSVERLSYDDLFQFRVCREVESGDHIVCCKANTVRHE